MLQTVDPELACVVYRRRRALIVCSPELRDMPPAVPRLRKRLRRHRQKVDIRDIWGLRYDQPQTKVPGKHAQRKMCGFQNGYGLWVNHRPQPMRLFVLQPRSSQIISAGAC